MLSHHPVDHREPEPGALPGLLRGEEWLEDARLGGRVHPHAGVHDSQDRVRTGRQGLGPVGRGRLDLDAVGLDTQGAAARHGVARVHRQVHQDLLELARVGVDVPGPRSQSEEQLDVLADEPPQHPADLVDHRVEVEVLALQHLLAAEGQELPGETGGAIGRLLDLLDAATERIVRLQPAEEDRAAPGDDGEEVVEVVGHPAREAPHRFHLLGLSQLVLELLAPGDVHHGADHADTPPVGLAEHVAAVVDLRVRAVRAPAAVLRAPARVAALDGGVDVGHHPVAILRVDQLVPPGDVRPDLLLGVAEEGLDALVPPEPVADQVPVPHRVVGSARDELEALLALAEGAHEPLGGAARDLLVREELGVADGERGLGGQARQDGLVPVGEGPGRAVVDVEQALDAILDEHRDRHLGVDAEALDVLLVAVADPGIAEVVAGAHRAALGEDEAAEAPAGLDAGVGQRVVPRGGPVAQAHRVGAGHAQADHRPVAAAELLGRLGHPPEHGLQVEGASDGAGQLGEDLRLPPPVLLVREEARVLEGQRRLVGERLRHLHRARVEDAAGGVSHREHADEAILGQQGDREDRAIGRLLQVTAEIRAGLDARVREHVRRGDGPPLADGEPDRARARLAHLTPAARRIGRAGHRQRVEALRVRVEPIDHRGAAREEGAQALRDAQAHDVRLEALGEQPADAGERPRLLEARALPLQEARVLPLEAVQSRAERVVLVGVGGAVGSQRSHRVSVVEQGPRHG